MSQYFRPPRWPLQNFRIDWQTPTQRFGTIKFRWNQFIRVPPEHVRALFDWVYTSSSGEVRRLGERFSDLYYTKLDVGDDDDWFYVQALGRGGFGAVALFERRDNQTESTIDQVAVKTAQVTVLEAVDTFRPDLSLEAALMSQTNEFQEDGMVSLRNFKHYRTDNQWKYYFEYCPYGDLERLRMRYKAYGRYFPELFLWHLFYWLAKTCHEYSDANNWCDTSTEFWGQYVLSGYLLHSDIKLQNVFLGPPDPMMAPVDVSLYPIPRIADLGLAEIQSSSYQHNQAYLMEKGTPRWFPPELRWRQMDRDSYFYPFSSTLHDSAENDTYRKGRHQITSRANLWAIGAIMFYMVSLREDHVLDRKVNDILDESVLFPEPQLNQSVITDEDFRLVGNQYYSIELRTLIADCLNIRPEDRPTEQEAMDRAHASYTIWLRQVQQAGYGLPGSVTLQEAIETDPRYKVYFRENEIDGAPDNYRVTHQGINSSFWDNRFIHDFPWLNPDWGKLWPDTMPIDGTVPPPDWPDALKFAFQRTREEARHARQEAYAQGQAAAVAAQQQAQRQAAQLAAIQRWGIAGYGGVNPLDLYQNQDPNPNPAQFNIVDRLGLRKQPGFNGGGDDIDSPIMPQDYARNVRDNANFRFFGAVPQTRPARPARPPETPPACGAQDTPRPPDAPGAEQAGDYAFGAAGPRRSARGGTHRWSPYTQGGNAG